jgi:rubrerythrin
MKFFAEKERFNCNCCFKLILSVNHPKRCPYCKAPGSKIIKLPPKIIIPPKK